MEERTSDVNFSTGVARRGRTKLRLRPLFTSPASEQHQPCTWLYRGHYWERSSISCLICTLCQKFSMWVAFGIVNDAALLLHADKSAVLLCGRGRQDRERQRPSRALRSIQGPPNKEREHHLLVCRMIRPRHATVRHSSERVRRFSAFLTVTDRPGLRVGRCFVLCVRK